VALWLRGSVALLPGRIPNCRPHECVTQSRRHRLAGKSVDVVVVGRVADVVFLFVVVVVVVVVALVVIVAVIVDVA